MWRKNDSYIHDIVEFREKKAGDICEKAPKAVKPGNCVWGHCNDTGDLRDFVL